MADEFATQMRGIMGNVADEVATQNKRTMAKCYHELTSLVAEKLAQAHDEVKQLTEKTKMLTDLNESLKNQLSLKKEHDQLQVAMQKPALAHVEDRWLEWQKRVKELVRESGKDGIGLSHFRYAWGEKWPGDRIESYQPQAKLKKAIQNCPGVEITEDDNVIFGGMSGMCKQEEEAPKTPRPSARPRSRSRSPMKSLSVKDVIPLIKQVVAEIRNESDPHQDEAMGKPSAALLRSFARDASRLDPAQRPEATAEWRDSIEIVKIDDLLQSHDTVAAKFSNGLHAGQSVDSLVDKLCAGVASVSDLPHLVVARHRENGVDRLWVVFGNRRLKAMREARRRGWTVQDLHCIVHDIDERSYLCETSQLIPFFCKYLLARTSHTGAEAPFRSGRVVRRHADASATGSAGPSSQVIGSVGVGPPRALSLIRPRTVQPLKSVKKWPTLLQMPKGSVATRFHT